ncbi:MAG: energy transducer TonB [Pyrinomonadaceae bacterium]
MKKSPILLLLILIFCLHAFAQDTRLKILDQPRPELPQKHGTLDIQGIVVLRVQFLEFGEIGEIITVKELPAGLTQNAIAAARRIKFEPEKKDGKPVTVYRELQYSYSWNGGWLDPGTKNEAERPAAGDPARAAAIITKAVQLLGGDRYLQVKTQIGKGKFSILRESTVVSFQSFLDVIVFPEKERTEFKGNGSRTIQVNTGSTGWVFDGDQELIKIQTPSQIDDFKRGMRTSLDNLLRGGWEGEAELGYFGKRPASLGKRNDVLKLTYEDGFAVEFEFSADDGMPQKAVYLRGNEESEEIKEEDRYAQFIDVGGIKAPFIIDRFTNGKPSSRINFETIEFNKQIPDSIFAKPATPKDAKKDIKL